MQGLLTINGKYSKIKVDIPSLTNLARLENIKKENRQELIPMDHLDISSNINTVILRYVL